MPVVKSLLVVWMAGVITRKMNIAYVQSGGPTAVINRTMLGVRVAVLCQRVNRIFGAVNGPKGLIEDRFIDLGSSFTKSYFYGVASAPGQALGSFRKEPTEEECEKIVGNFRSHDIHGLLYNGGDDSAQSLAQIKAHADKTGYELLVSHLPKTVDNDLPFNDFTPGFPSAARYLASMAQNHDCDNRSLPGVYVGVTMGKNAGFLVASTALARDPRYEDSAPHLIYMPEVMFDENKFVNDVAAVVDRFGRCVVAVSEGIGKLVGGKFTELVVALGKSLGSDGFGGAALSGTTSLGDALVNILKEGLPEGTRVRQGTFGYEQRVCAQLVSGVDKDAAESVGRYGVMTMLGERLTSCSIIGMDMEQVTPGGRESGSIIIVPRAMDDLVSGRETGPHDPTFSVARLEDVAPDKEKAKALGLSVKRTMPPEFIAPNGVDVTPAFLNYARPLVGELQQYERLDLTNLIGPDEK